MNGLFEAKLVTVGWWCDGGVMVGHLLNNTDNTAMLQSHLLIHQDNSPCSRALNPHITTVYCFKI